MQYTQILFKRNGSSSIIQTFFILYLFVITFLYYNIVFSYWYVFLFLPHHCYFWYCTLLHFIKYYLFHIGTFSVLPFHVIRFLKSLPFKANFQNLPLIKWKKINEYYNSLTSPFHILIPLRRHLFISLFHEKPPRKATLIMLSFNIP